MFLLDLLELKERLDLLVMAFPLKPSSVCQAQLHQNSSAIQGFFVYAETSVYMT